MHAQCHGVVCLYDDNDFQCHNDAWAYTRQRGTLGTLISYTGVTSHSTPKLRYYYTNLLLQPCAELYIATMECILLVHVWVGVSEERRERLSK